MHANLITLAVHTFTYAFTVIDFLPFAQNARPVGAKGTEVDSEKEIVLQQF